MDNYDQFQILTRNPIYNFNWFLWIFPIKDMTTQLSLKIVFQLKMCFFEKSQKMQFFLVKNHVKSLAKNFAFLEISEKKKIKSTKK